ncbi:hypothetical protein [Mycolicibacterium fortuitum]|uniref:hypothetical protein n=1 Tax=Mycolicibacterium fortuitum TaxID=1766 RepID=UPI000B2A8408|nr:hypothetical protein [Mycolicibacterium fortuitum]
MNLALRPYVTAGVALVGAGVIAATPVASPTPALQTHAVQLSAAVQDPVSQWVGIANRTFTQSGAIVQSILENPAPILQQIAVNQLGYAQQIGAGLQTLANLVSAKLDPNNPYGIVQTLISAGKLIEQGDAAAASQIIWQQMFQSTLFSLFPLAGLTQIPAKMAQNFANAVTAVAGMPLTFGVSAFGMLHAPFVAFEETATDLSAALANQDTAGAALALASFPGRVIDYTINGIPFNGVGYQGLIGAGGLIPNLVAAGETIAKAIAPQPAEEDLATQATSADKTAYAVEANRTTDPTGATQEVDSASVNADTSPNSAPPSAEQQDTPETVSDTSTGASKPVVRKNVVATPGTTTTTKQPAVKAAAEIRAGISATVNKLGEGVKKAFNKPDKTAKPDNVKSSEGNNSAGKHRAGSGKSGDAK